MSATNGDAPITPSQTEPTSVAPGTASSAPESGHAVAPETAPTSNAPAPSQAAAPAAPSPETGKEKHTLKEFMAQAESGFKEAEKERRKSQKKGKGSSNPHVAALEEGEEAFRSVYEAQKSVFENEKLRKMVGDSFQEAIASMNGSIGEIFSRKKDKHPVTDMQEQQAQEQAQAQPAQEQEQAQAQPAQEQEQAQAQPAQEQEQPAPAQAQQEQEQAMANRQYVEIEMTPIVNREMMPISKKKRTEQEDDKENEADNIDEEDVDAPASDGSGPPKL